jgi:hypothetical protein
VSRKEFAFLVRVYWLVAGLQLLVIIFDLLRHHWWSASFVAVSDAWVVFSITFHTNERFRNRVTEWLRHRGRGG